MNPYEILEIPKGSTQETIRQAYKKLALRYHPDRNKDNKEFNEMKFKEINEAYEKLTNSSYQHSSMGFSDIFADLFSTLFTPEQKKNELSIYREITLTLADVYNGKRIIFTYERQVPKGEKPCISCQGKGLIYSITKDTELHNTIQPCKMCGGIGVLGDLVLEPCKVEIIIPPGFNEKTLFYSKHGHKDLRHNEGDLFIHVNYKRDMVFVRDGADLKTGITITFKESLFGTQYELKHLSGDTLIIPIDGPLRHGKVLRVKANGFPKNNGIGDLIIRVNVDLPNEEELQILRKVFN